MRKRRKSPAKSIILDKRIWLRNADDIKRYRDEKLKQQDGKCAILKIKPLKPVLDHAHSNVSGNVQEEGRVRGVLESDVNMLEGRYLKLFQRAKIEEKYGITFPEFLISMGEYLQQDNSEALFHHKYMQDFRKDISKWRKDVLIQKLEEDFDIKVDPKTLVKDLIQIYVQHFVYSVEEMF